MYDIISDHVNINTTLHDMGCTFVDKTPVKLATEAAFLSYII